MSKSKTKSSSTSSATQNSTTTPTVAPWLSQGYQNLGGLIDKYATTDPASYVTGPTASQKNAFETASNLGGWRGTLGLAGSMANTAGNSTVAPSKFDPAAASTASGYIGSYMNPYLSQVVDATLADYDVNSGKTRAAQSAQAAKNGAFGGSRYAIREAQTEGELARGRATTEAQLRAQAYQAALAAAQADADRAQQTAMSNSSLGLQNNQFNAGLTQAGLDRQLTAAGLLGNFANSQATNQQNDVNTGLLAGEAERQIQQQQATALPDWLKSISDLYGSIPIGSFTSINSNGTSTGQQQGTQSTTGFGLSDIAKAAQMAAMFSDERLKTNIEFSHKDSAGRNWYNYNYIWEPDVTRNGVMAQEILKTDPHAVIMDDSGYYKVDYGSLRQDRI